MIYDVTELRVLLRVLGKALTDSALKEWCDDNIVYTPRYVNQDLSSKIDIQDKIFVTGGTVVAKKFMESEGISMIAPVSEAVASKSVYFDNNEKYIRVYNNSSNGAVTHTFIDINDTKLSSEDRKAIQDSPFIDKHTTCLRITTNGEAVP